MRWRSTVKRAPTKEPRHDPEAPAATRSRPGLGSLIPTAPRRRPTRRRRPRSTAVPRGRRPRRRRRRGRRCRRAATGSAARRRPDGRRPVAAAERRGRRLAAPGRGRLLRRAAGHGDRPRTRVSRARSSTRRRWPSWCTRSARSGCCSRSSYARPVTGRYELIMGERRWRATQEAGLDDDPGDRPGDRRRRPAARRPAGEPAPLPAEPARGGGRLPAAARRLRLHPRGAGHPDRPEPPADQQHPAAAPALPGRAAPRRRRRAVRRSRPRPARRRERRRPGPARRPGRGRGHLGARPGGDRRRRRPRHRHPARPSGAAVRPPRRSTDLASRLSDRLETRVKVDLGKRKGRITVEFASLPDLERIIGLIDPGHPTRERQAD